MNEIHSIYCFFFIIYDQRSYLILLYFVKLHIKIIEIFLQLLKIFKCCLNIDFPLKKETRQIFQGRTLI